ncbi:MAG: SCO family protein [Caulobacterales bacterium]
MSMSFARAAGAATLALATIVAACGPAAKSSSDEAKPAAAASATATTIPADVLARLGKDLDDVALTDQSGAAVAWKDLNGAPRAVFFGFTHCPEICPSTMAALQAAKDAAGPTAAGLRIDFVSIDPSRDTPAALKAYFASFGPGVRGLTGSDEAIAQVAKSFRAAYRKSDLGGGDYTMDHTTLVYLLDASGAVRDVAAYNAPPERLAVQIKTLTAGQTSD